MRIWELKSWQSFLGSTEARIYNTKGTSRVKARSSYCEVHLSYMQYEHDEATDDGNRSVFAMSFSLLFFVAKYVFCIHPRPSSFILHLQRFISNE